MKWSAQISKEVPRSDPYQRSTGATTCHRRAEDLQEECATAAHSVAGLDGFRPAELALVSHRVAHWLCVLLSRVEGGSPWPCDLEVAKAHGISKPGTDDLDPLSFRVLLILLALYR